MAPILLYNTLTRRKEEFKPIKGKTVGLYTCGPTVYWFAHIGNLRTYIFEDLLRRMLEYNSYKVNHIMNITDVGHLTSDADTGEDKLVKAAAKEKKTVWEIAKFYTTAFKKDLKSLNIQSPIKWAKATDHIQDQIKLIKILEQKGYAYIIDDGVYFDTSKVDDYGKLARLDIEGLKKGARVEFNPQKRNPIDFALWKFSPKGEKRQMEWDSPWGKGFPGWHIECSAMSMKYLGETFDIHCGGIDHIPVHHTNEIAQSEAATGKPFVKFWLHGEFLTIGKDEKMAKSGGQIITLSQLIKMGFDPLSYRYLNLTAHYRSPLQFSQTNILAAQNTLAHLREIIADFDAPRIGCAQYEQKFWESINDDLNMPKALAVMWEMIKSDYPSRAKHQSILKFDRVLGLNLVKIKKKKLVIPANVKKLIAQREIARTEKDFQKSDQLRQKIEELGFVVEDTRGGPLIRRKI